MSDREEFRDALGRAEERINERQDKLIARVEEGIDRIFAKVDLRMDASDKTSEIERRELKTALGELRDGAIIQGRLIAAQGKQIEELQKGRADSLRASAEGAAKGAGEAAGVAAAQAAEVVASVRNKPFLKSWVGRLVVACSAFTALITALGVVPNVLKAAELFWRFIRGFAK